MGEDVQLAPRCFRQSPNDLQAVKTDGAALFHVGIANRSGFAERDVNALVWKRRREHASHSVQGPCQIDGGRARRVQRACRFLEVRIG